MLLKGKNAIVTGGARGIGKEIVMDFLREGANVVFVDLNPSESLAEMEQAAAAAGGTVSFRKADVADPDEIGPAIEAIIAGMGKVDILVNNAGITRDGLIFRMPVADWEKVLRINLTSAFLISQVVARAMIKQRSGSIVNMASIVGVGGNAGPGQLRGLEGGADRPDPQPRQGGRRPRGARERGGSRLHRHGHDPRPARAGARGVRRRRLR